MDFLKKPALKSSRSLQFESLENRELLSANTLQTLTAYAQADNPAEIRFTVSTNDAKPASFALKAYGNGALDPSKIELRSSSGTVLALSSATDGTKTTASTGSVSLDPGSYTAYIYAENGTAGNLTFEIAQVPSSASPGLVYLIEAAILQQQDGWSAVRSSYTKLLEPYFGWGSYENLNTAKKSMLDLNGDGKITTADLGLAKTLATNPGTATITSATVTPQDLTPPTISLALKNGSATGTTDPTLTGKITDANGIKTGSAQYSLDNGTSWAALSLDSGGNYTIPASTFTALGSHTVLVRASDTKGNHGNGSISFVYIATTSTNPKVDDNGTGKVSVGAGLQVQTVNGTAFPANNQITLPGEGTITKNADGTLSFVVDPALPGNIPKGQTETVAVQVASKDSIGNTYITPVEFKVVGTHTQPVVDAVTLPVSVDAKLTIWVEDIVSDTNPGASHEFVSIAVADVSGTKTLNAVNRTIVLDSGTTLELAADLKSLTIDGETRNGILGPDQSEQLTLAITVRDDSLAANAVSTVGNVAVYIQGVAYQAPKITNPAVLKLAEDATALSTFTLSDYISDRNVPERTTTDWYTISGMSLTATGIGSNDVSAFWNYADGVLSLNAPLGNFDFLKEGETATLTFRYTVRDDLSGLEVQGTIRVEILGKNNPPVFDGTVPSFDVTEGTGQPNKDIAFDELLQNWTDKDHSRTELAVKAVELFSVQEGSPISGGELFQIASEFCSVNASGRIVSFSTSHDIFRQLGEGQSVELTFQYTVFDPNGGRGTGWFSVIVNGQNDSPTFTVQKTFFGLRNNSKVSVLTLDPVCGDIADVDSNDAGLLRFDLDSVSLARGFSIDPITGLLSIGNAELAKLSGDYSITVILSDDRGGTASNNLTVRIQPEPNPVVADRTLRVDENDSPKTVDLTTAVTKTPGRTYSVDAAPVLRSGVLPSGVGIGDVAAINANGVFTFTPGEYFQYLSAGEPLELVFEFTVSDNEFENCRTTATITVTVVGENNAPSIIGDSSFAVTNSGKAAGASLDVAAFGVSDIDRNDKHTWSIGPVVCTAGRNFGSLPPIQIDNDGKLTLTNTNLPLAPGESTTLTFTVFVSDGTETAGREISVTVHAKQAPNVTQTPGNFEFNESEFDDDFTAEWIIGVSDPTESFASWTQRTGNGWFDIGQPSFSMILNGTDYTDSNINPESLRYEIVGNDVDGYKLVLRPTAGLFDFLNADDELTLRIQFTVCDTEYGVIQTVTQNIVIRGEASQHSITDVVQDSFSVWTNKREADSFVFDPGFTISDVDTAPAYTYSISGFSVTSNPNGLTEEMVRLYFTINETTGAVTLDENATGNFDCKITVCVRKDGADDVEHDLTVEVRTAQNPTATEISGSFPEDCKTGFAGTPTFASPSGKYSLSELTLPASLAVSHPDYERSVAWTDAMNACLTFDTATGKFRFTPNGVFDFLAADETLTAEFTYTISDSVYDVSATGVIRLEIVGKNNAPVLKKEQWIDYFPLRVDSAEGSVYHLNLLAYDVDFGDELEFHSITIGSNVYVFDNANSIYVPEYGTFTRESGASGKFLRFVPDRTGHFSSLIAEDENADGFRKTEKFDFGYTVVDKSAASASGTISVTMQGVNHLPAPTKKPSDYGESLSTVLSIDLSEHFTDKDLENNDSLQFSIPEFTATNTFIESMEIVGGKLLVTYLSSEEFDWSTNTNPIKVVVTANDRYTGSCTKGFTFSLDTAQTVGLSIIPVAEPSNGTKPQTGSVSETNGPYYVEVWASDLFPNGTGGEYVISFGFNANTADFDSAPFTLTVDDDTISNVWLQANNYQGVVMGTVSIPSDGNVLLFRIKVEPDKTLTTEQVVKFSITVPDIKRGGVVVDESQILSAAVEVTHRPLPQPTSASASGQVVAFSAWEPTMWSTASQTVWDDYEYLQFLDGNLAGTPLSSSDTLLDDEWSLGAGYGSGGVTGSPFTSDVDPFAPVGSANDPLDRFYAEDYEQSLAEHLLGLV